MSITETLGYRSPVSKLLRFFQRSRDQWKSKCQVAKQENKSLKVRLAKMKESRDRWKAKARCAVASAEVTGAPPPLSETKNHVRQVLRGPGAGVACADCRTQ
jgi:hypothetical protein